MKEFKVIHLFVSRELHEELWEAHRYNKRVTANQYGFRTFIKIIFENFLKTFNEKKKQNTFLS